MFEISSSDGRTILGDFDVPQQARALVVTVHGQKGDREWGFFPWLGDYLGGVGVVAVRFTMPEEAYRAQVEHLLVVASHARSRFRGLPLFLLGHSLGGAVALLAAGQIDDLAGVVTWSGISRGEGVDLADVVPKLRVPLLAIHGSNDSSVPPEDSRRIVAAAGDGSLLIIDGASHTYNAIHPLVYVPRALEWAALVSARFVCAYS